MDCFFLSPLHNVNAKRTQSKSSTRRSSFANNSTMHSNTTLQDRQNGPAIDVGGLSSYVLEKRTLSQYSCSPERGPLKMEGHENVGRYIFSVGIMTFMLGHDDQVGHASIIFTLSIMRGRVQMRTERPNDAEVPAKILVQNSLRVICCFCRQDGTTHTSRHTTKAISRSAKPGT